MYRLKLAKYSDKNISNSLKEVEGTIQAMSATHEMLYAQKVVSQLDTQEYFFRLIERLKTSYNCSQIKIELNVDATLDIDTSIYIGIILNELVTNSLKYAFNDKKGSIKISLTQENQKYKLLVEDNGIGFDMTKESDTFGLELVKTLAEEELKGKLTINADNGVSCCIDF
jgi:two-component sensor histidine kinase